METINGTPISPGIAIGKVFIKKSSSKEIFQKKIEDKDAETGRFHKARLSAIEEVRGIYINMLETRGEEEAAIFTAHIEMLEDVELISEIESVIDELSCNSEWAVKKVRDSFVEIFEAMEDEYMSERAADIKDITGRIIRILHGNEGQFTMNFKEPVIIVADDLAPSDTAQMNPKLVIGIINESGGSTSHAAIIARMLGIPFVVYPKITSLVENNQTIAFDGEAGTIELDLNPDVLREYTQKQNDYKQMKLDLEQLKGTRSVTKDGYEVLLAGNIGSTEDAKYVLEQDGSGVGLFRTEFLYMNREDYPKEEEQFMAYKKTAENMEGNPVIIRTLDIGGDKEVDYLHIPKEDNPFLGYRAIRLCLDRVPFWKVQLRALLRASVFGNIHIMFPMIVSMEELVKAKEILEEVKSELRSEGTPFNENIPVGMMIETPAAALMADVFAKEVDFFSIGTNDLIQYTMAVDRMNQKVAHLYSPYDPAVIRFIKHIVDSAHTNGIWAGICGESAADKYLIPLWVGMGLDELSMSPGSILPTRKKIQGLSKTWCEELVKEIMLLKTAKEVVVALKKVD